MPHAPALPLARTSAAISAVAAARPGASLVAMILALLLRILARADAAWFLPEDEYDEYEEYEDEYGFDAYAFCGADPYALHPRPVGSAPHAIYVEAGLIADWILAGVRNRGMRALPRAAPSPHRTQPARAPPPRSNAKEEALSPSGQGDCIWPERIARGLPKQVFLHGDGETERSK
jgi:hypothetical protein